MPAATAWKAHPWVAEPPRVRFGAAHIGLSDDWHALAEWARAAEELGFDSCWLPDHPVAHSRDCWTLLAGLAAVTRRIHLGSLVTCVYYRHPALLARIVADVDRISGGRAVLGLGIGDIEKEFAQLGMALPPPRDRLRAQAEYVRIVRALWRGEEVTFAGGHFRTDGAVLKNLPVQRPRIPVLIAGGGEQVTLRQVARYADASNFGPGEVTGGAFGPDDVRRKYAALDAHCAERGRAPESVLRTYFALTGQIQDGIAPAQRRITSAAGLEYQVFDGSPDDAVAYFRTLVEAGVRYFIFSASTTDRLRLFAERIMPGLSA